MGFEVCTNDEFLNQNLFFFFFPYLPRFESKNLTLSQKNKKMSFSWKILDECSIKHGFWSMHKWRILKSSITFLLYLPRFENKNLTLSQKNKNMSFTWKWKISDECKKKCLHAFHGKFQMNEVQNIKFEVCIQGKLSNHILLFFFLYLVRFENKKLHFQSKKTRKCHSHGKFQIDVIQTCDLKYAHTTNSQNTH